LREINNHFQKKPFYLVLVNAKTGIRKIRVPFV